MKLYNTLSRQIEEVKPLNVPEVTVYTCGPTVYDYPHVGNWFTYIREDILIRTLKMSGLQPKWVMNITDVGHLTSDADEGEDKLEKGARREGKTAWDVAKFYTDYFVNGMKRLNMLQPDYLPKATEHIKEQIELIQKLEEKGYTYTISDGVYYDTSKFPHYADFARLDLDEQQAGARVEVNPEKRNATDFALWKFSPTDHQRDMEWDSPWAPPGAPEENRKGFPGWHIECSAMSMKYLGETLDIHAGGIDHVPVHHTNEIAQSEAVTGKPFARYWMHSNHITVEGDKISKSLGNGITLEDIEAKDISLEAFRLHVLESHYRSQSKFSWESLQSSKFSLRNIRNNFSWIYQSGIMRDEPREGLYANFQKGKEEILQALQNDLDTPKAIAILHEFAGGFAGVDASQLDIPAVEDFANFIDQSLGIQILDNKYELPASIKSLIDARNKARTEQEWKKSDELRDKLTEQGIGLRDTPHGAIWYRL